MKIFNPFPPISADKVYHNTVCFLLFQLVFLQCRSDDKLAVLLYLLKQVVKPSEQTVVFAATKHHVEYLNMVSPVLIL